MTTTEAPALDWTRARTALGNAVRHQGPDSEEAAAARLEFWCVRTCALLTEMLTQHNLTDEQRARIAAIALTTGR